MRADLALLRVIKYRESFDKVKSYIPKDEAISKRTRLIVKDIDKYFKIHTDATVVDLTGFRSLFFTSWHRTMKDEEVKFYNTVLEKMETDETTLSSSNIINMLIELEFSVEVANIVQDFDQGEDIDIINTVASLTDRAKTITERTNVLDFADLDDNDLDKDQKDGLEWHLPIMRDTYRPCSAGDLYIIAARPGKGKTSFLTHMNYGFASQLPEHKHIYWFNNEGRKQRIIQRQIQAALAATIPEVAAYKADGSLNERYIEAMKSKDKVRVFDIHSKSNMDLVDMLKLPEEGSIGAIIFDMLDNVKYLTRQDMRHDLVLEELYKWARELGVLHDCPVFATSQISLDGDANLYPTESMLKDSKTGKQGACDGIIMIGCANNPLTPLERGLSMPKEKCKRPGMPHMREPLIFDEERARFGSAPTQ
jgi:replicative DNA helicase